MTKQNKTKLQFIFGATLVLAFAFTACNNEAEKKDAPVETTTVTPPPVVKDTIDTMEAIPGKVAPGNDVKPQ
jgi:hypothetical protein